MTQYIILYNKYKKYKNKYIILKNNIFERFYYFLGYEIEPMNFNNLIIGYNYISYLYL
jgi:hypothetical protein